MENSSTYRFDTDFFDDDFTGRMSWNVFGKRILRAAAQHAEERGFENIERNGHTYLWVLSRMTIETERMPRVSENGTITTWLSAAYRCFVERNFTINDQSGRETARVHTVWALIDAKSRRPVNLSEVTDDGLQQFVVADKTLSLPRPQRIDTDRLKETEQRRVYYSDLDKNGHLNSIRYIDYALDTFSTEYLENHRPSRIETAYCRESVWGDTVTILKERADISADTCETYQLAMTRRGKPACRCCISFSKI